MQVSRTWQARLRRLRGQSARAGRIVVVAAAIFGAAAGCKVFLAPDRPNFAAIAQRVGNQADQVGAFAADFVTTWLTATTNQRPALQRFTTSADNTVALPATPAAVVTTPQVVSVIHTGTAGDFGQRTPLRLCRGDPRLLPGAGVNVELPAPRAGDARAGQRPRPRR
jgi:hypothetical protein